MNCPNCNAPYEGDLRYCPKCGHPLSNAQYTQLSDRKRSQKRHKGRRLLLVLVILIIAAAAAGLVGYRLYLGLIEKKCKEAVDQFFTIAHNLNVSSVDPELLPEELQEEPDIKVLIKKKLFESMEIDPDSIAGSAVSKYLDTDKLLDDIVSSASYEILSADADLKTCKVKVRTSNTDYVALSSQVYKELMSELSDTDNLWKSIGSFFSSIIGGKQEGEDSDLSEKFAEIYRSAKEQTPEVSSTGFLTFGQEDGSWTLIDVDKNIILSYYGASSLAESNEQ